MTAFVQLDGLDQVPAALRGGIVAIGNFDGVHSGHQHVLAEARRMASARGVPATILTFEPHPRDVFAPKPFLFRLTDSVGKARLASALGFDGLAVMPFDRGFAAIEAGEFVERFLIKALGAAGVVVGADFHFGKARMGTPDFLRTAGAAKGFGVTQLDLLEDKGEEVSSSRVRQALTASDLATANRLLGYHFVLNGTVIMGDQRGRELGYPTANFALPDNSGFAQGVYAARVRLGDRLLDGVAAYGKPMFDNSQPPFEVHIFDFDEDIYGQEIQVALISFIRGQMVFAGLEGLISQMDADCAKARAAIAGVQPLSDLDGQLGFITRG